MKHRFEIRYAVVFLMMVLMALLRWMLAPVAAYAERTLVLWANHKGSEGVVHIGTNAVAELRGYSYDEEAAVIDDSILTDEWATNKTGMKSWSGSATAWYDETDTNGQQALSVGAEVTLKFYPEGTAASASYRSGTAIVRSVGAAAAINGIVERNFNFTGNGALSTAAV